jgi:P4 family phage/plasmid primase-like protien
MLSISALPEDVQHVQVAANVAHPQHSANGATINANGTAGAQCNGTAPQSATLDGLTFDFSTFRAKADNTPKPQTLPWRGVCNLLAARRFRETKDGALISGASYPTGATRGNENADFVSLAILDFDGGATRESIETGVSRLNNGDGAAAFLYSTFSHTPETPKFRLVLPLAQPVPALDWPDVWQRLFFAFDSKPDRSRKDTAGMHYLTSCPKIREADAVEKEIDGAPLDVATLPFLPEETRETPVFAPQNIGGDPYARKAFEGEIARLCATSGNRNDALNRAALALGHFVGAGRLDRAEVERALFDAAHSNGYIAKDGARDARATIQSGLNAGEREPNFKGLPETPLNGNQVAARLHTSTVATQQDARDIPAPAMRTERGAAEYEAGQLVKIIRPGWTCAALSTHAAHASRIFENIGGDLRFSSKLGWLTFGGRHWTRDDRHATQTANRAKELSQVVRSEGAALYGLAGNLAQEGRGGDAEAMSRAAAAHIRHAKQVEAKNFVEGALHFAAGNPETRVEPDAFDQRPWLLGFENGVWDKGKWREHRREDFLLHLCPVALDFYADQTEWLRVLDCMTGGDADFARTLQDAAGYILSGASHLRFLPWLYGPKGTGKSTFAELLQTVLGRMAATIDPKKLQDDAARERLGADLWNRRLAVCAEAGGQKLEAELLKTLSGSDMLTVRFLYQEAFDALPRHVLLMVSNDAPRLDAYDDALKDRVVALPFVHRLDEKGPLELTGGARIEAVRKDPLSPLVCGFAAWAVEGLARVFETQSIFRAACIETATAKFWSDTDPLTPFWETLDADELRRGISKSELRKAYETWCEAEGARAFNRNLWARACESFGLEDFHNGKARCWRLTQLTQLRQFPESPREKIKETHGLSEKEASCVSCVSNGVEREKVKV